MQRAVEMGRSEKIDVYQFKRLRPLLKCISARPDFIGRKNMSLRIWANKLGYKSPRSVGMIFDGHRLPSVAMLVQLAALLRLNSEETEYLLALLLLEKVKTRDGQLQAHEATIDRMNPSILGEKILSEASFRYIAQWQHLAIKQLFTKQYQQVDVLALRKKLKNKLSEHEIQSAIENLLLLGLVEKSEAGEGYRLKVGSISTLDDIPSAAIRQHHSEMMTRAQEALLEDGVADREYTSATFSFERDKIGEVKELMRGFRNKLEKLFAQEGAKDVYQLNLQFFSHTRKVDES